MPDWRQHAPFPRALREPGWVAGYNPAIESRWADGRVEFLPQLAAEPGQLWVNLIVALGLHASAATKQATRAILIVMAGVLHLVGTGLVATLAWPGGNVTGTALDLPAIAGKLFEVLLAAPPPGPVRRGPLAPHRARRHRRRAGKSGRGLGRTFQSVEVREPHHPETTLATIVPDRPDVLYVGVDPITASPRAQILHFATRHGVPAIYTTRTVVDAGGLLSYGRMSLPCPRGRQPTWIIFSRAASRPTCWSSGLQRSSW